MHSRTPTIRMARLVSQTSSAEPKFAFTMPKLVRMPSIGERLRSTVDTLVNIAKTATISPGSRHSAVPSWVRMPTMIVATTTETTLRGRKNEPIETGRPSAMSSSPAYHAEASTPPTAESSSDESTSTAKPAPVRFGVAVSAKPPPVFVGLKLSGETACSRGPFNEPSKPRTSPNTRVATTRGTAFFVNEFHAQETPSPTLNGGLKPGGG